MACIHEIKLYHSDSKENHIIKHKQAGTLLAKKFKIEQCHIYGQKLHPRDDKPKYNNFVQSKA